MLCAPIQLCNLKWKTHDFQDEFGAFSQFLKRHFSTKSEPGGQAASAHVAETLRLLSVMFMVVKLHICAFIHERPRGCSGVLEVVISVYNLWTYSRTL